MLLLKEVFSGNADNGFW